MAYNSLQGSLSEACICNVVFKKGMPHNLRADDKTAPAEPVDCHVLHCIELPNLQMPEVNGELSQDSLVLPGVLQGICAQSPSVSGLPQPCSYII